ncbi:hypothetical protein BIWAKO_03483 [Bosea sp. BIWAKO-01]|nr:hypothetical protein BIWAKO_03483 [Bosea sp. BIWAKO-01]
MASARAREEVVEAGSVARVVIDPFPFRSPRGVFIRGDEEFRAYLG